MCIICYRWSWHSKGIDEIADKRIHTTDNKHNDENPHDEFKNHPGKFNELIEYAGHKINHKDNNRRG